MKWFCSSVFGVRLNMRMSVCVCVCVCNCTVLRFMFGVVVHIPTDIHSLIAYNIFISILESNSIYDHRERV